MDTFHLKQNQTLKLKAHFKKNRIIREHEAEMANTLGMKFLIIMPGSLQPGGTGALVRVEEFYLQATETTQKQWYRLMGKNPSRFQGCDHCPVEQVSLRDVQDFIRNLNSREANGRYRLPTQEEWEYACLAGRNTAYSFGNRSRHLGDYAWYKKNSRKKTHPVAGKKPNRLGLFDMHGNVSEWCEDLYSGTTPVCRGGDYSDKAKLLSAYLREIPPNASGSATIGFRLVWEP